MVWRRDRTLTRDNAPLGPSRTARRKDLRRFSRTKNPKIKEDKKWKDSKRWSAVRQGFLGARKSGHEGRDSRGGRLSTGKRKGKTSNIRDGSA